MGGILGRIVKMISEHWKFREKYKTEAQNKTLKILRNNFGNSCRCPERNSRGNLFKGSLETFEKKNNLKESRRYSGINIRCNPLRYPGNNHWRHPRKKPENKSKLIIRRNLRRILGGIPGENYLLEPMETFVRKT